TFLSVERICVPPETECDITKKRTGRRIADVNGTHIRSKRKRPIGGRNSTAETAPIIVKRTQL
ncbi:Hypothetical predicted protein, partial [Pelobates cultripes]